MSTERWIVPALLAVAAVAAAPAPAQDSEPPVTEELGRVPDPPTDPGEPPRRVEDDLFLEDVEDSGLGSYFLTSFSLGGAYDRAAHVESVLVEPPPPTPGRPGIPAPEPEEPTIERRGVRTEETGFLVRPTFMFVHRPSARGGVVLAYEPEFEQLDRGDRPDRVSHSAGVAVDHRATRRTDLSAGASYLDSLDPSRHLGGDGFVLIPGRFEQSRIHAGLSHLWRRATRLHLYTEYSSAESDLATDGIPIDLSDLTGTIALEQGIGRRSDITLSYSYTDSDLRSLDIEAPIDGEAPIDEDPIDGEAPLPTLDRFSGPVESVRLGFGHRPSPRFSFHLAGGALREREEAGEYDTSWIGSGEVAREGEALRLRLRYDRSLFAFGAGDVALGEVADDPFLPGGTVLRDTVADTVSFHAEMTPRGRLRWEQSVWLSRRTVFEGDDVDSFVTASMVEVLLTGANAARVGMFARFDYYDRGESELLGESFSRERFSLGFRVGLSGPQTKAAHRLALDDLRRVLPSGGRF